MQTITLTLKKVTLLLSELHIYLLKPNLCVYTWQDTFVQIYHMIPAVQRFYFTPYVVILECPHL